MSGTFAATLPLREKMPSLAFDGKRRQKRFSK